MALVPAPLQRPGWSQEAGGPSPGSACAGGCCPSIPAGIPAGLRRWLGGRSARPCGSLRAGTWRRRNSAPGLQPAGRSPRRWALADQRQCRVRIQELETPLGLSDVEIPWLKVNNPNLKGGRLPDGSGEVQLSGPRSRLVSRQHQLSPATAFAGLKAKQLPLRQRAAAMAASPTPEATTGLRGFGRAPEMKHRIKLGSKSIPSGGPQKIARSP